MLSFVPFVLSNLRVSKLLELNPKDNQGVRFLLHDLNEGLSWEESLVRDEERMRMLEGRKHETRKARKHDGHERKHERHEKEHEGHEWGEQKWRPKKFWSTNTRRSPMLA